jgi:hypothetical protein
MTEPTRSLRLDCDCVDRCTILAVDFDRWGEDENTWTWDFYTNSGYDTSWRHRLRIIWNLLRGRDHYYFHGTVHTVEDMARLARFLQATLPKPPIATTTGGSVTYLPEAPAPHERPGA